MFKFLKIIQPTWYYTVKPKIDNVYFPDLETIQLWNSDLLPDTEFSPQGAMLELSYRAHRLGFTKKTYGKRIDWWQEADITLEDEYRFSRKYFHPSRVMYVFLIRVISFKNPFKEFKALQNSRSSKSYKLPYPTTPPNEFGKFDSMLIKRSPKVSVIIPTLNRYQHLTNILHDFEKQDYKNFEVIVVDQSEPFNSDFYQSFQLQLNIIRQEEKALWKARNTAIKVSKGNFIALSEDDVRIPADWISNHLKCIDYFDSDISAGVFFPAGKTIPSDRNFFKWADQFATGNACLKKEVFEKIGLFDRQFEKQRMGDGEFGMRAYMAGFKSISNPYAWCEDVKASSGGLRQMGSWDAFRPKSFWSPRPVPSVLYFYRKYFGNRAALYSLITNIPSSIVPYQLKRNKKILILGSILFLIIMPLILIQVIRSWNKATHMLKNEMIENYNA